MLVEFCRGCTVRSWRDADGGALACRESGVKGSLACASQRPHVQGYKAIAVGSQLGASTSSRVGGRKLSTTEMDAAARSW